MTQPHHRNSGLICLEYSLDIRIFGSPQVTQCRTKVKSHCGGGFWSSRCQQLSATHLRLSSLPPSKVQVLYGGTDLFDYEVRRTFNNDMLLAFISSSCIAALVYILTSCSGRPPQKAQQEPAPFFPPHALLSHQSLPSPECQKSS